MGCSGDGNLAAKKCEFVEFERKDEDSRGPCEAEPHIYRLLPLASSPKQRKKLVPSTIYYEASPHNKHTLLSKHIMRLSLIITRKYPEHRNIKNMHAIATQMTHENIINHHNSNYDCIIERNSHCVCVSLA